MRPAAHRKLVFERLEHRQLLSASPLTNPIPVTLAADGSSTQTGQLANPGDQTGYKFTAAQTGMMVIREIPTGSSIFPTNVSLYNAAQSKISSLYNDPAYPAANASLTTRVVAQVTKGSTYYTVAAAQAGTIGSYQLQFVMDDAGDTPALASTISLINSGAVTLVGSATQLGKINYAGDVDVYKFSAVVPGGGAGIMTIRMSPQSSPARPALYVYNANYLSNPSEAPLVMNDSLSSGTVYAQVTVPVSPGSVYYIKTLADVNSIGAYQLQLSTVKDDGLPHTFAQADAAWQSNPIQIIPQVNSLDTPVGPLSVTGPGTTAPAGDPATPPGVYGNIYYAGQADYIRFVAPITGTMTIRQLPDTNQGSALDPYLYLYDAKQNLIVSSNFNQSQLQGRVTFNIQAGSNYYLKASGFGNSTGAYQILFYTTGAVTDDFPQMPPFTGTNQPATLAVDSFTGSVLAYTDPATGTVTVVSGGVPGNIDYVGDVDWFSFLAPVNGTMAVQESAVSASLTPQVSVYSLNASGNPTILVSQAKLGSVATFSVTFGNQYYIKAAAANQTAGQYAIQTSIVSVSPAAVAATHSVNTIAGKSAAYNYLLAAIAELQGNSSPAAVDAALIKYLAMLG